MVQSTASGTLTLTPPTEQDKVGDIVLYVMSLNNMLNLKSSQLIYQGEIVVELLPTNSEINNGDYAGIITYGPDDPNPTSDIDYTTIDGVQVSEYKTGISFQGNAKASSSFSADSLLGPMAGKTIADFTTALEAGEISVVVRTEAYPQGELVGTLSSKALPPAAEQVITSSAVSMTVGTVAAGLVAFFGTF